jgi:ribosome-binding ATPase YchF (GTP1/OBG family)
VIPTSAGSELALRNAAKAGIIKYKPGDSDFEIIDPSKLNEKQKAGLEYIREHVLKKYGCTGVQKCIETAVFQMLDYITVYPVEDEHKLTNKDGNPLPDVRLVKKGTTAKEFAFKVHTEIGKNFIRAIDSRTRMVIGADHVLKDCDVVKIVSAR